MISDGLPHQVRAAQKAKAEAMELRLRELWEAGQDDEDLGTALVRVRCELFHRVQVSAPECH